MSKIKEFYISPDLGNDDLTKSIDCFNEAGEQIKLPVVTEVPLTIYLNKVLQRARNRVAQVMCVFSNSCDNKGSYFLLPRAVSRSGPPCLTRFLEHFDESDPSLGRPKASKID